MLLLRILRRPLVLFPRFASVGRSEKPIYEAFDVYPTMMGSRSAWINGTSCGRLNVRKTLPFVQNVCFARGRTIFFEVSDG